MGQHIPTIKYIFLGLIALLAIGAQGRNFAWNNDEVLWRDAVAKSPGKSRPNHNYCSAIWNAEVERRDPDGENTDIAGMYRYRYETDVFDNAMWTLAKRYCAKAWRLDPKNSAISMTLGKIALHELEWEVAEVYFQRIVLFGDRLTQRLVPEAYNNLALAQMMRGKAEQACANFEIAAEMGHEPAVHNNEQCKSRGF